jgi:hypothetical protein
VSSFHDDVDRRVGHDGVIPERRVAINRARDTAPEFVVELRHRQHANLAADGADAVDFGDPLLQIVLLVRHGDPAGEHNHPVFHGGIDVIEYRQARVGRDGAADVFRQADVSPILRERRAAECDEQRNCRRD